jgi:CheY-like chemotaxis protein
MSAGEVVLLVNDIPDHLASYRRVLTEHGFNVKVARSGQEALELVHDVLPECAIIDTRLPDMTGWELCREMKADDKIEDVPIVVLTPDVSKMCAADSAKSGCNAWLAHPTVAEDLARTVRQVLDLNTAAPASPDEALRGLTQCPACYSDQIKATLRVSPIQYYCCRLCGFCWRAEALVPATR